MVDIVIVGSIGYDDIQTPYGKVENVLGGSVSYASIAASFFGSKVGIVAAVGNDFGEEDIKFLSQYGICTKGLYILEGKTFHWAGIYNEMNIAKTVGLELGVFKNFKPILPKEYRNAKYLFLANIDPDLQSYVLTQMKNPALVMLDTRDHWINNKKNKLIDAIKSVDILLVNDQEAKLLLDTNNLIVAGRSLLDLGVKAVIVKKGEHGSLLFTDDKIFSIPAYPVENVKDPTGAGDSFAGALIGFLSKNGFSEENLRKAIVYASVIASFTVEGFSLEMLKNITMEDVVARYQEMRDIVNF